MKISREVTVLWSVALSYYFSHPLTKKSIRQFV